jgi:hypothetical protein
MTLISFPAMIAIGLLINSLNYKISLGLICFYVGGLSYLSANHLLKKFCICTNSIISLAILFFSFLFFNICFK